MSNKDSINIILPNQLFRKSELIDNGSKTYLIEENLFFNYYKFHKQKIAFQRSSMKKYMTFLESKGLEVIYVNSYEDISDIRIFLKQIDKAIKIVSIYEPIDNWIAKRMFNDNNNFDFTIHDNPLFINKSQDLTSFFRPDKKNFSHAVFYKQQRKKMGILMDESNNPIGGKFSFDADNRKKYPKSLKPPVISNNKSDSYWLEAIDYTEKYFKDNYGSITKEPLYPNDFKQADKWFDAFLSDRFKQFGDYEDAIVSSEVHLNHSILTPCLNTGLLNPIDIVAKCQSYAMKYNIPLNSLEGFIRQVIGWREFIRGMYVAKGTFSRTKNFWSYKRKIPSSFYSGTTGIDPVDDSINKTIDYAYCHHIERLMILGNFMLLCQFDPNEVYKWFMELFIDAYDWVMVPNVYGMSQFADGGLFATKPYISSSNYIKKMSNYKDGDWCLVWDSLYWNFIKTHASFFKSNPRLSMMVHLYNKMSVDKKDAHSLRSENFLKNLQ